MRHLSEKPVNGMKLRRKLKSPRALSLRKTASVSGQVLADLLPKIDAKAAPRTRGQMLTQLIMDWLMGPPDANGYKPEPGAQPLIKDILMRIAFDALELAYLQIAAGGVEVQVWARYVLLGQPLPPPRYRERPLSAEASAGIRMMALACNIIIELKSDLKQRGLESAELNRKLDKILESLRKGMKLATGD